MKLALRMSSVLSIAKNIFAVTTIIFSFWSIMNPENWVLRIITQVNAFFLTLFNGLYVIIYANNKPLGYLLIGTSIFVLVALIFTVLIALHLGVL
jgi:hypothetical protein